MFLDVKISLENIYPVFQNRVLKIFIRYFKIGFEDIYLIFEISFEDIYLIFRIGFEDKLFALYGWVADSPVFGL